MKSIDRTEDREVARKLLEGGGVNGSIKLKGVTYSLGEDGGLVTSQTREEIILEALGPQYSNLVPYGNGSNRDTYTVSWSPTAEFRDEWKEGKVTRKYETRFVRVDKGQITHPAANSNNQRGYGTRREMGTLLGLNGHSDRPQNHNLEALLDAGTIDSGETVSVSTFIPNSHNVAHMIEKTGPMKDVYHLGMFHNVFRGVIDAVGYMHEQGLYHRDLTPKNILVDLKWNGHVVDLGLAKRMDDSSTDSNMPTTLAKSMSDPRVQKDGSKYDTQAEVYAIGANMYYALTGKFLAEGVSLKEIPRRVRSLVGRCLTPDLKKRYKDVGQLREAFEKVYNPSRRMPKFPLIASALGIIGATYLVSLSKDLKSLEKQKAETVQVSTDWDRRDLSIGNSVLDIDVDANLARAFSDGEKADSNKDDGIMIVNEGDYKRDSGKGALSLTVKAGKVPLPKLGQKKLDIPMYNLPFRVYVEGERDVKTGEVYPDSFDQSAALDGFMNQSLGNFLSLNLPSWDGSKGMVRTLAVELYVPEDIQRYAFDGSTQFRFPPAGTVLARKRIPLVFDDGNKNTKKLSLKQLHLEGLSNWFSFDNIDGNAADSLEDMVVSNYSLSLGSLGSPVKNWNNIISGVPLIPRLDKGVEDIYGLAVYSPDGKLVTFTAVPIVGEPTAYSSPMVRLSDNTRDLPGRLADFYEKLPKRIETKK